MKGDLQSSEKASVEAGRSTPHDAIVARFHENTHVFFREQPAKTATFCNIVRNPD